MHHYNYDALIFRLAYDMKSLRGCEWVFYYILNPPRMTFDLWLSNYGFWISIYDLLTVLFMFHVCHAFSSVHWERANLLNLLCVMFYCVLSLSSVMSWVRCGTDCIDFWSLSPYLLLDNFWRKSEQMEDITNDDSD